MHTGILLVYKLCTGGSECAHKQVCINVGTCVCPLACVWVSVHGCMDVCLHVCDCAAAVTAKEGIVRSEGCTLIINGISGAV